MMQPQTHNAVGNIPIYLILPAHNEEQNIRQVLGEYTRFFCHPETCFHIIINNSTDRTWVYVQTLLKDDRRIRVTNIPEKIGKGGAILHGLRTYSGKEHYVGFVDTDGSIAPEDYGKLVSALQDNNNLGMAISSRWIKGADIVIKQPIFRRVSSRLFNYIVRLLFSLPYHDTQCGAKLLSRNAWQKLHPLLSEASFAFDIELLWLAKKHNIHAKEIPIRWADSPNSSVDIPKNIVPVFLALIRIRLS